MRLTHHTKYSRSFIIIVVIVIAAVYSVFTLSKIQKLSTDKQDNESHHVFSQQEIDTTGWQPYRDTTYPLNINVPPDWTVSSYDKLSGYYIVSLTPPKSKAAINIYVSPQGYAGTDDLVGTKQTTASGYQATDYDGLIYTLKTKDFYYTFDTTNQPENDKILGEIVRTVRFN